MRPPLVNYTTEREYRSHYETHYCHVHIYTFDGVRVYFPKQQFDDAFFESANRKARDKTIFSRQRAERIDWIAAALRDPQAEHYVGWDRGRKTYRYDRRVTIVWGDYVVVLNISRKKGSATFITAYVAGKHTIQKIRRNPRWV